MLHHHSTPTVRAMRGQPGLPVYPPRVSAQHRGLKQVCGHWYNDFLGRTARGWSSPWPSGFRTLDTQGCLELSPFPCPCRATKCAQLLLCRASLVSAPGLHQHSQIQTRTRKRNFLVDLTILSLFISNPSAVLSSVGT